MKMQWFSVLIMLSSGTHIQANSRRVPTSTGRKPKKSTLRRTNPFFLPHELTTPTGTQKTKILGIVTIKGKEKEALVNSNGRAYIVRQGSRFNGYQVHRINAHALTLLKDGSEETISMSEKTEN